MPSPPWSSLIALSQSQTQKTWIWSFLLFLYPIAFCFSYGTFHTAHYLLLFFFFFFFNLWLCWVFVSVRGLSLIAASGGHSSSRCAGLSLSRPPLLRSTGSRCAGSAIVAHGPRRSAACGIFPDQGSNPCPLHWQADSQPLRHQGSPVTILNRLQIPCGHRLIHPFIFILV